MKHKIASEIFGYPIEHYKLNPNLMKEIEKGGFISPFTKKKNGKQTRLLKIPMGVDSVYWNDTPVIIDPNRFLQDETIFKDVAIKFWGSDENVIKLPEVKLKNVGSFDFVMVKHKKLSYEIEDFIILEIQSDSTTGTGALVKNLNDLYTKEANNLESSYPFGMNTYNTIKLSFMQMLIKGMVAEKWDKNVCWVMQDFVFQNMLNRFDIANNDFDNEKHTHYFTYNMLRKNEKDIFHLSLDKIRSYDVLELKRAFDSDRSLPEVDCFVNILKKRITQQFPKN